MNFIQTQTLHTCTLYIVKLYKNLNFVHFTVFTFAGGDMEINKNFIGMIKYNKI